MRFVIASFHFLPMAGAEAYCTTRFASALAASGHEVTVVTMDWPQQVSDDVITKLIDPRLSVVRVPLAVPTRAPVAARLWYMTHEWDSVNLPSFIAALRGVLKGRPESVLISRTHPMVSLIGAWHCRHLAAQWIAHFSDPIPFYGGKLKQGLMRLWCRRAFREANGISVTCANAVRFFKEAYGLSFPSERAFVTPHLGDPWLGTNERFERIDDLPMIVHTGLFYAGRGALPLLEAMRTLAAAGFGCRFVQVGEVDPAIRGVFSGVPNVSEVSDKSPSLSAAVVEASDVSFVSDVQLPGDYIPYMPSKFVYQLFTDKPMVIYTKCDSPMGQCCRQFPDSGLYFADADKPETLPDAIRAACQGRAFDRRDIRARFSPKRVIGDFLSHVNGL